MVVRIAAAIGISSRLIDIPLPVLRGFITLVALIPRYRHVNPEMATRISLDMCFDNQDAIRELNFAPRIFLGEAVAAER